MHFATYSKYNSNIGFLNRNLFLITVGCVTQDDTFFIVKALLLQTNSINVKIKA